MSLEIPSFTSKQENKRNTGKKYKADHPGEAQDKDPVAASLPVPKHYTATLQRIKLLE